MRTSLLLAAFAVAAPAARSEPPADLVRSLGAGRWRHHVPLVDLRPLPDGRVAAVDSAGGLVLWDAAGHRQRRCPPAEPAGADDRPFLVASPDGRALAICRRDSVELRDAGTGDFRCRLAGGGEWQGVTGAAFSADGLEFVTANGSGLLRWWSSADGSLRLGSKVRPAGAFQVAVSPKGKWVATDGPFRCVDLWHVSDRRAPAWRDPALQVAGMAFSPAGELAVAWTDTATVLRIDRLDPTPTPLLEPRTALEVEGPLAGLEWAGGKLWAATPKTGRFIGPDAAGKPIDLGGVRIARPDPEGGRVFGLRDGAHSLAVWEDGQPTRDDGHAGPVVAVQFAPDGKSLFTAGADDTVSVWDVASGRQLRRTSTGHGGTTAFALSPDGKRLATTGFDRVVRVCSATDGSGAVTRDVAADGLAWAGPKTVLTVGLRGSYLQGYWEVESGMASAEDGLPTTASVVAVSADTRYVAAAARGNGQVVRVLDRKVGKAFRVQCLGTTDDVVALAVAADLAGDGPAVAAAGTDGTIRLWRAAAEPSPGEGLLWSGKAESNVRGLAFAPGGHWLAAAEADGTVRLWETPSGQSAASFAAHGGSARAVAFSPDGRLLASGGDDTSARLWRVMPEPASSGLPVLWDRLAGNAPEAREAIAALARGGEPAAEFLAERLLADAPPGGQRLEAAVGGLKGRTFAIRERSEKEIATAGERARPILEQALAAGPPPEARARLVRLLERLGRVRPAGWLRHARAIEALAHGGPAGAAVLRRLADRAEFARMAGTRIALSEK